MVAEYIPLASVSYGGLTGPQRVRTLWYRFYAFAPYELIELTHQLDGTITVDLLAWGWENENKRVTWFYPSTPLPRREAPEKNNIPETRFAFIWLLKEFQKHLKDHWNYDPTN